MDWFYKNPYDDRGFFFISKRTFFSHLAPRSWEQDCFIVLVFISWALGRRKKLRRSCILYCTIIESSVQKLYLLSIKQFQYQIALDSLI